MSKWIRTAILGCGNIADRYATFITKYPEIQLAGFSDIDVGRAEEFTERFGGRTYRDLEELLDDATVELVVNLTIHHAHAEVIERCLKAGKHVHTEKPLALNIMDARSLITLAEERGLRLSSAPSNFMGEAQQTVCSLIRSGQLGTTRLIYAEVNHGRIESWHPNPEPFYAVGIMWDVAVYPLTLITAMHGRVTTVMACSHLLYPDRVTKEGRAFHISTPDYYLASLKLASGPVIRLTANFYVDGGKQGGSVEFHGDKGSVYLRNFQEFDAAVEFQAYGTDYAPVTLVREAAERYEFSRGVEDLAQAMIEGRPHRSSSAHAAHVVDVVSAIVQSAAENRTVSVESDFPLPPPMPWAIT